MTIIITITIIISLIHHHHCHHDHDRHHDHDHDKHQHNTNDPDLRPVWPPTSWWSTECWQPRFLFVFVTSLFSPALVYCYIMVTMLRHLNWSDKTGQSDQTPDFSNNWLTLKTPWANLDIYIFLRLSKYFFIPVFLGLWRHRVHEGG